MKTKFLVPVLLILTVVFPNVLSSQTRSRDLNVTSDPRGPVELVVCSLNLENYGSLRDAKRKTPSLTADQFNAKEIILAKRMALAGCDVIAVQELLGKSELEALQALQTLASALRRATNRYFEAKTGATNDPDLHNGYLIAKDRAEVLSILSYYDVQLPKILPEQKPRMFPRGPLEIQLQVKGRGESLAKAVTLVTFHFKSHAGAIGDPSGLQWETYRMEMAEALRRVVENRHANAFLESEELLIVLGDRNSHYDEASAKILEGVLTLKQFQGTAPCRLSKRGVPLCQADVAQPQKLFSVITADPQTKQQPGTFNFKTIYYWLDDILMPQASLPFARATSYEEGDYDSGVVYEPEGGTDHALVYVKLNW